MRYLAIYERDKGWELGDLPVGMIVDHADAGGYHAMLWSNRIQSWAYDPDWCANFIGMREYKDQIRPTDRDAGEALALFIARGRLPLPSEEAILAYFQGNRDEKASAGGADRRVTPAQAEFLGMTPEMIKSWAERVAPLGVSEVDYAGLRQRLSSGLTVDKIDLSTVDCRLSGSSVSFFARPEKRFPQPGEVPPGLEGVYESWPGERLNQRPFDTMYRLGLESQPSDLNFEFFSDTMVSKAQQIQRIFFPADDDAFDPESGSIRQHIVELAFPGLYKASAFESVRLGRPVSLAVRDSYRPEEGELPFVTWKVEL